MRLPYLKEGEALHYQYVDVRRDNNNTIIRREGDGLVAKVRSNDWILQTTTGEKRRIYCTLPANKRDGTQTVVFNDYGYCITWKYMDNLLTDFSESKAIYTFKKYQKQHADNLKYNL